MRRFQTITIMLLLLVALAGCAQFEDKDEMTDKDATGTYEETGLEQNDNIPSAEEIYDQLFFSSIEELLGSYIVAKDSRADGGDIDSLVSKWNATYDSSSLEDVVKSTNFTSFEKLYLPTSIPEDYQLYRIGVTDDSVNYWYLHKDDMVSEDAIQDALVHFRHFLFIVTRWDMDSSFLVDAMLAQSNATKEDLIDGKYLFLEPHSLDWVYERERFVLYMPIQRNAKGEIVTGSDIAGLIVNSGDDMIKYAKTSTVNLLDRNEVMSLIGEDVKTQVDEILMASETTE